MLAILAVIDLAAPVLEFLGPMWGPIVLVLGGLVLPKLASKMTNHPVIAKILGKLGSLLAPSATPATPAVTPANTSPPAAPTPVSAPLTPDHPVIQGILAKLEAIAQKVLTSTTTALLLLLLLPVFAFAGDPSVSAVKVWCLGASGQPTAGGSGVVVASDGKHSLVITNRHVAECSTRHQVVAGESTYAARFLGYAPAADLAGLLVDVGLPAAPIADQVPADGTPLKLYGYPAAGQGKLVVKSGSAAGHQLASVDGRPWTYQFRTTFVSQSGDSGGGVFDGAGRVVAINWGNDGRRSECVCLQDLRTFAEKCWCDCGGDCLCDPKDCPDGKCPLRPAAEVLDYAAARASVEAGKAIVLYLGVTSPKGAYYVESLPGKTAGVYDCYLSGGVPVMRLREPEVRTVVPPPKPAPAAAPAAVPSCPNGQCPNARRTVPPVRWR